MFRFNALTMPPLTLSPTPSGLPIASTGSPTCTAALSPQVIAGSGFGGSTFSSATSDTRSAARTWAGNWLPSENVAMIS